MIHFFLFVHNTQYTCKPIPGIRLSWERSAVAFSCIYGFSCYVVTPPKFDHGLLRRFSPPLSLSASLSTFWGFRFGNDNYRICYHYRSYFGLIVPKRFWFRYLTLGNTIQRGLRRGGLTSACGSAHAPMDEDVCKPRQQIGQVQQQ